MEEHDKKLITVERPTGPRIVVSEPKSLGQLALYKSGKIAKTVTSVAIAGIATGLTFLTRHKYATGITSTIALSVATHFIVAATMMTGVMYGKSSGSYTGPGDIVSGATAFYSCSFAYNAAYANGTNPLCDINSVTGGISVCTLRVQTNGQVDLAASYCAGTTPAAACAAALGGSCIVSKAYDQTSSGNDALNGSPTTMPALEFNSLNGLPCLHPLGSHALVTSSTFTANQPFAFTGVGNRTPTSSALMRFFAFSATTTFGWRGSANTFGDNFGSALQATASDAAFHAFITNIATGGGSGTSNMVVDGSSNTGSAGSNNVSGLSLGWMADPSIGNGTIGYGCEGGFWPATEFTGPQLTSLNSNMHTRWGF